MRLNTEAGFYTEFLPLAFLFVAFVVLLVLECNYWEPRREKLKQEEEDRVIRERERRLERLNSTHALCPDKFEWTP